FFLVFLAPLIDCFPTIDSWRSETLTNLEERVRSPQPCRRWRFLFLNSPRIDWTRLTTPLCGRTGSSRSHNLRTILSLSLSLSRSFANSTNRCPVGFRQGKND
ncbi:unnamed protein product, partial [Musa hybrid cultivar]